MVHLVLRQKDSLNLLILDYHLLLDSFLLQSKQTTNPQRLCCKSLYVCNMWYVCMCKHVHEQQNMHTIGKGGHRRLQLCGYPGKTWLCRILCAIAESIFGNYTVRYTYVCMCTHICYMLVTTCASCRSSWYEYAWFEITQAMPGYAWACRRLWGRLAWNYLRKGISA